MPELYVQPAAMEPLLPESAGGVLADAIEKLFQRPVDLVTDQSVRNPYFRRVVDASRQPIYERQDAQAAV